MDEAETKLRMLILAGLAGDAAAYRRLMASCGDRLRRYFDRRLRSDAAEAEDLVQETLLAIHQKRDSYNVALPCTAWMYAIARYKLVDHHRRRGYRAVVPMDDLPDLLPADGVESALAAQDIEDLLCRIPEKPGCYPTDQDRRLFRCRGIRDHRPVGISDKGRSSPWLEEAHEPNAGQPARIIEAGTRC